MSPPTVHFNFDQLIGLVVSLFSVEELRRLCSYWPVGRPLAQDIALYGTGSEIARLAVQQLVRAGLVDEFILLLQEKRPLRRDEIDGVQRRWWVHRQAEAGDPATPLPLSAEMERIQLFTEGDDAVVHRETTGLHLLYGMLAVPLGYEAQARVSQLCRPNDLLRALKSLARVADVEIPEGTRILRQGYERLWIEANELARRRGGDTLQYPDMLLAICSLRPAAIQEYLQMIDVSWDALERAVRRAPATLEPEATQTLRSITMELADRPPDLPPPPPQRLAHYKTVFTQFVDLKRAIGEALDDFTLERFVHALHAKTAVLLQQPDVVEVRFVPYIKDGKVALRANFRRHDGAADNN